MIRLCITFIVDSVVLFNNYFVCRFALLIVGRFIAFTQIFSVVWRLLVAVIFFYNHLWMIYYRLIYLLCMYIMLLPFVLVTRWRWGGGRWRLNFGKCLSGGLCLCDHSLLLSLDLIRLCLSWKILRSWLRNSFEFLLYWFFLLCYYFLVFFSRMHNSLLIAFDSVLSRYLLLIWYLSFKSYIDLFIYWFLSHSVATLREWVIYLNCLDTSFDCCLLFFYFFLFLGLLLRYLTIVSKLRRLIFLLLLLFLNLFNIWEDSISALLVDVFDHRGGYLWRTISVNDLLTVSGQFFTDVISIHNWLKRVVEDIFILVDFLDRIDLTRCRGLSLFMFYYMGAIRRFCLT